MADTTEIQDVQVLSLERVIESKLVQNNLTDQVLIALKEKYGGMQLKSLDDKEGYLEIKDAAKQCAKVRTLTVKTCKDGRERAVAEQKKWIEKEKEIVGRISEVETPLDAEISKFDAEVDRLATEEKNRQEEAYINRQATLTKMGAVYSDGSFALGEASFEAALIKGATQDVWDETIMPKFQVEYEKIEQVKIAEEKKKADEAADFKKKQDELLQKQKDLEAQEEAIKQYNHRLELAESKRQAEEKRLKEEAESKLWRSRLAMIDEAGWNGQYVFSRLGSDDEKIFTYEELISLPDSEFNRRLEAYNLSVKETKNKLAKIEEEKRLAEIEDAKKQAIIDEQNRQKKAEREAEQLKIMVEAKKQSELETASDKTKWDEFIRQLKEVDLFEMRSGQYRNKMKIAREKIEEIISL